jgi:hypothetical protein
MGWDISQIYRDRKQSSMEEWFWEVDFIEVYLGQTNVE